MKKNKKNNKKIMYVKAFVFIMLIIYISFGLISSAKCLKLTKYDYISDKVPSDFDGYKIIQISDLHHKNFGKDQSELISMINNQNPDLILLTGDIVDGNHTDMTPVVNLLKGIYKTAPIYFVSGNHELAPQGKDNYAKLETLFVEYGVVDLDDSFDIISKGESSINLYGAKFRSSYVKDYLDTPDTNEFNILMYHCTNYFDITSQFGYDLIFSGHTHGGIVRLPFVGGIFGNTGDVFPKYDKGVYKKESSTMISSGGLGDAKIPRFYNTPEVVLVTLYKK
ncbi:hypothetical protein SAMN02910289_01121 [Lachnospiraceae bacterium RM5]|nr:hypothetical protein SAMN02910289_01121 [Lachnospiraceae bacterium RM5]